MRQWLGVLLLGCLMGLGVGLARGAPQGGDNETDGYLFNGGFEGSYYEVGSGQVATGWSRVHLAGNPNWMSTCIFARGPDAPCTGDGGWVEKIGGDNSHILSVEHLGVGEPFETVLYQRVTGLVAGQSYSFSGWVLKMYGGSANGSPPPDPFSYASWIGVDPTGGSDPTAPSVVWGEQEWQREAQGHWENHRMAVTAQGSAMTLFVRLWLKWQKAESQGIVDAMELYDAPTVTLHTPTGYLATPYLDWSGTLPPMLAERGNYHLFYEVQQQQGDGSWAALASRLPDDGAPLPLVPGVATTLRVVPSSYQPSGQPLNWPPTTHVGLPSAPITVIYATVPPAVDIYATERWVAVAPFALRWQPSERAATVTGYDVDYRQSGATSWSRWFSGTTATSATFGAANSPAPVVAGEEWEFRARAYDMGGQRGAWSPPTKVGVAEARLRGRLRAASGVLLSGATVWVEPWSFREPPTINLGSYELPLVVSGTYTLTFRDAAGVERLPATPLAIVGREAVRDWYFPPVVSRVSNGHFEAGMGGWTGALEQVAGGSSGRYAARLPEGATISQSVSVTAGDVLSLVWYAASGDARLEVQVANEVRELVAAGQAGWQHWHGPVTATGAQVVALRAVGGEVWVDEVALGKPEAAPAYQLLPIVRR